jgi:hypothetical protein
LDESGEGSRDLASGGVWDGEDTREASVVINERNDIRCTADGAWEGTRKVSRDELT